jgi:hypothetical protein
MRTETDRDEREVCSGIISYFWRENILICFVGEEMFFRKSFLQLALREEFYFKRKNKKRKNILVYFRRNFCK